MSRRLIDALGTTAALADLFSDASVLQALLDVETALAWSEADAGVIPAEAAAAIARAGKAEHYDAPGLAAAARQSASLVVPLVKALTARVGETDAGAARYVHWGTTSQDVLDSAMSLLVVRAHEVLARDRAVLTAALRDLSNRHRDDVMLGRTLLQPAVPITFGLKAAIWFSGEQRSWRRLEQAVRDAAVLQFGGAAGTLVSLGEHAGAVTDSLAARLALPRPPAPWHSNRDRVAALVAACALYVGSLGKIARDISLLMQFEVGEAAEPGGTSSAMPHKRNPSGCAIVLAAHARLPGLAAAALAGLDQEHERGLGGWQAEWPTLADALQTTGSALDAARATIDGLAVDPARMRANLDATRGTVLSEPLSRLAARTLGVDRAKAAVQRALDRVTSEGRTLAAVVGDIPELRDALSADERAALDDISSFLGQAERFRRQLLEDD